MQAYAEGFEIMHASGYGLDLAQVSGIWRYGSVVRSWLLDLLHDALAKNREFDGIKDWVADSGEGRWTVQEAIDRDVPAPIITLSLQTRFRSRQDRATGEVRLPSATSSAATGEDRCGPMTRPAEPGTPVAA
jgi:6-phosphogluconate dehydrogenase